MGNNLQVQVVKCVGIVLREKKEMMLWSKKG
jgi:hypothetical protein